MPRSVAILGSTGSIGRQTLDVIRDFPEELRVIGLAGRRNVNLLRRQAVEFEPDVVVTGGDSPELDINPKGMLQGEEGMVELVEREDVDLVVVATVGHAGLRPTLAALAAGKLVALANKEVLVMAGPIIRRLLDGGRGALVPIDSEHSAIWQCVQGEQKRSIERLIITASGGALRDMPPEEMSRVTPEQALRHPNWTMGPKVTIDSATLMNKGLEVIEARWLFDVPIDKIDVVLHRESIVHS
ncbi:MAG: 1-deoxy-D-xylulose-5-phosphate reductoisomerase, partial [Chloroflexota bacterium]